MRHAAKVDKTQAAIVEALRQAGASVWVIGLPVDLLVGIRSKNYLMECKSPLDRVKKPRNGSLTDLQADFIASWQGDRPHVVATPEEALRAVGLI